MPSKRYKSLPKDTKKLKPEVFENLIKNIKENCSTKFDESIDLSLQISTKQKKGEINLRTVVNLPAGSGKKIKIAVICEESRINDAKNAGADLVGSEELIKKIESGEISFDKLIATPGMMIKLSKIGKILGPKGLMPNPKLGTVTNEIEKAIKDVKSGQVEIKNDKDGNIGLSIGKKSFSNENLIKNFNSIMETILKEKPDNIKGEYIKNIFITSSMGVSYKLKLNKSI